MVRPAAYRAAVGLVMKEFDLSLRRACRALGFPRSSWHYQSQRTVPVELIEKLHALASKRPSWGYRMLHAMLRRAGHAVNHKRVYRLYRQEGLTVRRRKHKHRVAMARTVLPAPARPNERWSMDFMSDRLADGRAFRVLTVVDQFSRETLPIPKVNFKKFEFITVTELKFVLWKRRFDHPYQPGYGGELRSITIKISKAWIAWC